MLRTTWVKLSALLAALVLAAPAVALAAPAAQDTDSDGEYFDASGHYVGSPFYSFFSEYGGVSVFGYPITEQFFDYRLGRQVQYFENARFEFWPENSSEYKVQLGLIADELGWGSPVGAPAAPASDANCRYFSATGQSACHAFLRFFDENGGLEVFGYPTDGYRVVEGRLVQSFQRAVLEWRPELPRGARVQIAPLGVENFERFGYSPTLTDPFLSANIDIALTDLTVAASLRLPVVGQGDVETVFVLIEDQLGEPVEGAVSQVLVNYPTEVVTYTLPPSDASGLAKWNFPVLDGAPGEIVNIEVLVHHRGLRAATRTSFVLWW